MGRRRSDTTRPPPAPSGAGGRGNGAAPRSRGVFDASRRRTSYLNAADAHADRDALFARVQLAALLVEDAMNHRRVELSRERRVTQAKLGHVLSRAWYQNSVMMVLLTFMVLVVWQPQQSDDVCDADGTQFFSSHPLVAAISFFVWALAAADIALTGIANGWQQIFRHPWFVVSFVCIVACFIELCASLVSCHVYHVTRPLRAVLFINRVRPVRELLLTTCRAVLRMLDIIVLTLLAFACFSDIANDLFSNLQVPGYKETNDNFDSFWDSLLRCGAARTWPVVGVALKAACASPRLTRRHGTLHVCCPPQRTVFSC